MHVVGSSQFLNDGLHESDFVFQLSYIVSDVPHGYRFRFRQGGLLINPHALVGRTRFEVAACT